MTDEEKKPIPLFAGEAGNPDREQIGECEVETLPTGEIEITNFIYDKEVAETIVGAQNFKGVLPPLPWTEA